ncbi:hypothetical protein IFM89_016361 [Coptis chinensis]|uniref:Ethylene insensitive 3-like DNA-binding domain-containing protein n=1 Tax=Coptis chinensis TaxID=261450 RepID=A0A835LJK3_9MAGN|nr:hypothetical protein IFM89_016361 [Coptis chinensis]
MENLMMDENVFGDNSDVEGENIADKDVSDEEIDAEELERRMWKDRVKLKRIRERQKVMAQRDADKLKPKQTSDQARRKKMSRAQDGILKYMLKLMEVCKARGFVYGIIPEKGKPVSGASDNIRAWWKEKVKFDKNGPAAIANNDNGALGVPETPPGAFGGRKEAAASSDSDYDVDGAEVGSGSDLSNDSDPRREPPDNSKLSVHYKEQVEEQRPRKRLRGKETRANRQAAPYHTEYLHGEPRNALPDMNVSDVQIVENPIDVIQPISSVMPLEKDFDGQPQLSESAVHNFSTLPNSMVATTQSMFVGGRPLLDPVRQEVELRPAVTNNFHDPLGAYGFPQNEQQMGVVMVNPHIRSEENRVNVPLLHGNMNESTVGEVHHNAKAESDQGRPGQNEFEYPYEGLSLDAIQGFDSFSPNNFKDFPIDFPSDFPGLDTAVYDFDDDFDYYYGGA